MRTTASSRTRFQGGPDYVERHRIHFWLTGQTASRARAICDKTGMGYGDLGRIAVLDYMNRLDVTEGAKK